MTGHRDVVHIDITEDIGVVTIDNPPVNALCASVRSGLSSAMAKLGAREHVKAVILRSRGRCFSAGADIREFAKPAIGPALPLVCDAIESCPKPVIAAIGGPALGGGLEAALSAHYRLASGAAQFALPEVKLGLLPGAGGTQRTPRLIGVREALELALGGDAVTASRARSIGLIDEVVAAGDLDRAAMAFARKLVGEGGVRTRPTRERSWTARDREAGEDALNRASSSRENATFAKSRIIEALRASLTLSFDEGMRRERALFLECMHSPEREALTHIFFAEKKSGRPKGGTVQPFGRIGVMGGGAMGAGIAASALLAGLRVDLVEVSDEAARRAREKVMSFTRRSLAKQETSPQAAQNEIENRFYAGCEVDRFGGSDVVIEAVYEDMDVKKSVFERLSAIVRADALLATNTSYLDVNEIARATTRPERVVGLHFFSPAHIMKLVEVIEADASSDVAIDTALALSRALGKIPVLARVCDGFIGNRIQFSYRQAADHMMEDGASPYEIDAAVRNFGFRMGPYQVSDLAGGDIGWATRKRKAKFRDPSERYVAIPDRLCERGWFGQKTGKGYYVYEEGERGGVPNPELPAIIEEERRAKGVTPRPFVEREIVNRYVCAMINEGARVIEDGVAARPSDIDVVFVNGYGFPRERGGPMKYADTLGLKTVLSMLRRFETENSLFWRPSPLIAKLADAGETFESMNG